MTYILIFLASCAIFLACLCNEIAGGNTWGMWCEHVLRLPILGPIIAIAGALFLLYAVIQSLAFIGRGLIRFLRQRAK